MELGIKFETPQWKRPFFSRVDLLNISANPVGKCSQYLWFERIFFLSLLICFKCTH